MYRENVEECLSLCQSLLDEPNLDTAVRAGDVYGLLIEHYAEAGKFEKVRCSHSLWVSVHVRFYFALGGDELNL